MLTIYPEKEYPDAVEFCKLFLREKTRPRYVLGRNEYAASIAEFVDVNGFIDDFTTETEYLGKPILKTAEISKDSLVVSVVVLGRPLIALEKLKSHGVASYLDYFKFLKYSGLALKEIDLFSLSKADLKRNWNKYQWLNDRLTDEQSKDVLSKLLNFRVSGDLDYMQGFKHDPEGQYFDDVLDWKPGEVFVDAGGFDGQTALNFIKRCPEYKSIHIFEPEPKNVVLARNNLSMYPNVYFYTLGLAESKKTLKFSSGDGSSSKVSETGDLVIQVDVLDSLIEEPISMVKMDIEGAEGIALQGAREHILKDHPKLAICCYHKFDDLWRIPEQILAIRDDYFMYLRHYEEGFVETVMYFIPDK